MTPDQEIAELKLQRDIFESRWKMSTRLVDIFAKERMGIVHQLYAHGLTVDGEGNVVKIGE